MASCSRPVVILAVTLLATACAKEIPIYSGPAFTTDPPATGPLRGMIITTNNASDTLTAVDLANRRIAHTIPVGFIPVELEGPHHIAAAPDGRFIYVNLSEAVAGSGLGPHGQHGRGDMPGFVLKIDTNDGRVLASVSVQANPGDVTISPDGRTLYVTHYDLLRWTAGVQAGDPRQGDSNLIVIDAETMTIQKTLPLCPAAHGVRLSADAQTLYATCGPDEIAIVRLSDENPVATRVPLTGTVNELGGCDRCPYALGVAPDGTVWVSSTGPNNGGSGGGDIRIYDPAMGAFDPARTVSVCGSAFFSAFAEVTGGGYRAYVPEQGSCGDTIRIFDPGSAGVAPTEVGRVDLPAANCMRAHMLLLSSDARTGYVICEGDRTGPGTFVFLDLEMRQVLSSFPIGVYPDGMTFVPEAP